MDDFSSSKNRLIFIFFFFFLSRIDAGIEVDGYSHEFLEVYNKTLLK
jgi:hypothetical protein